MLIQSTSELKAHAPVHRNMQFATLQPFVEQADRHLQQLIGTDQHAAVVAALGTSPAEPLATLLTLCTRYTALRALQLGVWQLRNHVSELGVQQSYSDSAGMSRPAPVEDAKKLQVTYQQQAYDTAEQILQHLESNTASFPLWANSEQFTTVAGCFVRNLAMLQQHLPLITSRQTFVAIRPYLLKAQKYFVRAKAGLALLTDLLEYQEKELKGESLAAYPAKYANLLPLCAEATALRGMLTALPYTNMVLLNNSLYLEDYNSGLEHTSKANYNRLLHMREDLRETAGMAENALDNYLQENVADLPLYEASEQWAEINPDVTENTITPNEDRPDFWI